MLWAELSTNEWRKDWWGGIVLEGQFATYVSDSLTQRGLFKEVSRRGTVRWVLHSTPTWRRASQKPWIASTITDSTFTLTLDGTPVSATVSYDPTTKKATLNPNTALQADETYTAKVKGECGHERHLRQSTEHR